MNSCRTSLWAPFAEWRIDYGAQVGSKRTANLTIYIHHAIELGLLVLWDSLSPCRCEGACSLFNNIHWVVVAMSALSLCI